jgi:hypothetical protein
MCQWKTELQKEYLIDMEDVVVVTKDDKGKVKLHQAVNLTAAGMVFGKSSDHWLLFRCVRGSHTPWPYAAGHRKHECGQAAD